MFLLTVTWLVLRRTLEFYMHMYMCMYMSCIGGLKPQALAPSVTPWPTTRGPHGRWAWPTHTRAREWQQYAPQARQHGGVIDFFFF